MQVSHSNARLSGLPITRPGIDVLLDDRRELLNGRAVGLVSNAASLTRDFETTASAMHRAASVHLVTLFAPEHGFSGAQRAGMTVSDMMESTTQLPVYSLYNEDGQRPSAKSLADIEVLVFDMQSVGSRFYTYLTTLFYLMTAAAEHALPIIVCDRPNPIGGEIIEGPLLEPDFASFVGCGPLPIRHGLTIGEAALLFNEVWGIGCDLTVIPCEGWLRSMWFDETGLTWVPPSPNIPRPETALLYSGVCLVEGTNLSEGRGTPLPFEIVGAPWIDGSELAERMNHFSLPGIKFRPLQFTPTASKWREQVCSGVQLHVRDRRTLRAVTVALYLIATIRQLHPDEFTWRLPQFDNLAGTDSVRISIEMETDAASIIGGWMPDQKQYADQRHGILLYGN